MKILCMSDLHLSATRPLCRTDADWVATQQKHLDHILFHVKQNNIPMAVIAGDIFDTPTVPPTITNMMLKFIFDLRAAGCQALFIGGNHDFPYHATERTAQCSFGALDLIRDMSIGGFDLFDFGKKLTPSRACMAAHEFVVLSEKDKVPGRQARTADELFATYPWKLMIFGDNHIHWHANKDGRLIVNCGTLIQRTAAEAKRPCGFYVVNTRDMSCAYEDLSFLSEGAIDTSYIDDLHERDENREQYEALIAELRDGTENRYDFAALLSEYLGSHRDELDPVVGRILSETLAYIKE